MLSEEIMEDEKFVQCYFDDTYMYHMYKYMYMYVYTVFEYTYTHTTYIKYMFMYSYVHISNNYRSYIKQKVMPFHFT